MTNIYNKLSQARKLVRETPIKKAGTNTYSKYDYFTPEQVEQIVADVCEKTKLLTICNLKRDEHGLLIQTLKLVDLEGDESIEFTLATEKGEMSATNEAQQMGGTDTYSERYIKMKVFQIKDNNLDFDSHDNRKQENTPKPAQNRQEPHPGGRNIEIHVKEIYKGKTKDGDPFEAISTTDGKVMVWKSSQLLGKLEVEETYAVDIDARGSLKKIYGGADDFVDTVQDALGIDTSDIPF